MPGKFYIEGKKKQIDISSILSALVVYHGQTTAIGALDGSTLICGHLRISLILMAIQLCCFLVIMPANREALVVRHFLAQCLFLRNSVDR